MNARVSTIGLLLRSLAGAARMPDVFGGHDGAAKIAPILDTLASVAELPEELQAERQALLEQVDRWVQENRGPTMEELDTFKRTRDELDNRAQAALASLPPKGAKAKAWVAAALLGVLALAGLAPRAEAQTGPVTGTLVLKWVNPTSYTDGSALPAAELVGNRVAWGTCAGTVFNKQGEHKRGVTTTDTITGLTAGGNYCAMVFASAKKAGATDAAESAASNSVAISLPAPVVITPPPGAPTSVTVTCTIDGKNVTCTGTLNAPLK